MPILTAFVLETNAAMMHLARRTMLTKNVLPVTASARPVITPTSPVYVSRINAPPMQRVKEAMPTKCVLLTALAYANLDIIWTLLEFVNKPNVAPHRTARPATATKNARVSNASANLDMSQTILGSAFSLNARLTAIAKLVGTPTKFVRLEAACATPLTTSMLLQHVFKSNATRHPTVTRPMSTRNVCPEVAPARPVTTLTPPLPVS